MSLHFIGASGHAKVILDIAEQAGIEVNGLYDKDENVTDLRGYTVRSEMHISASDELIISIGDNHIRKTLSHKFDKNRYGLLIHPMATVNSRVSLGGGTVVMAGTVINSDTVIGNHCIVNTAASVDHDCNIADYVHIAPNSTLCGGVDVGEGTLIGAGAVILPNIKIGSWVKIGAGSVVISDVETGQTVVGNPAKLL
ncbi:MAG: acetyltransferase [Bacteroidota bacterium]